MVAVRPADIGTTYDRRTRGRQFTSRAAPTPANWPDRFPCGTWPPRGGPRSRRPAGEPPQPCEQLLIVEHERERSGLDRLDERLDRRRLEGRILPSLADDARERHGRSPIAAIDGEHLAAAIATDRDHAGPIGELQVLPHLQ